jgi:hypothetical protein
MKALIRSRLLGYLSATLMVSDQAILSYTEYGTQWWIDGNWGPDTRTIGNEVHDNLPLIEAVGPQPPAVQTHAQIVAADQRIPGGSPDADTGWIFHFYLVANYFYFPNLTDLSLIGPPPLKLSEPRLVPGADLPVTLYPHPSGCLGLVVVEGLDCPLEDAMKEAYDAAMPLLDEISTRYDVPLPVAHSMAVGIPSGTIHIYFAQRPQSKDIVSAAELLPQ